MTALGDGRDIVKLAACVRINLRLKDDDAIAHDQKAMKRNRVDTHIIKRFGQDRGIETLTLRARRFPVGYRELVACVGKATTEKN